MKKVQILSLSILFGLTLGSLSALAVGDIESFFTNEKKADIQNRDIRGSEKAINKALGTKDVEVDVEWNTFEKIGYNGAQSLGANLQTVTGVIVNGASEEPKLKSDLAKKMKKLILRHDPTSDVPSFKLESGSLVFLGNYEHMNWKKAGSLRALLKKAL